MTLDESISSGQSGHLTDHDVLHEFHNDYLTVNPGIRYVRIDGDDSEDGLTWQTAKASVVGAQAAGGTVSEIYVGVGEYDIKTTIELVDGQKIVGAGTHSVFGTMLKAHADLGTDPLIKDSLAGGNLTSGGLFWLQLRGTNDASGGAGLVLTGNQADNWTMNHVQANGFSSHGFHWDIPGPGLAGNPVTIGIVNAFSCGLDGVGDGFRLEAPGNARVSFDYLGGDNNGGSLLVLDRLGDNAMVQIHNLKAERTIDDTHNVVVDVLNSTNGMLSIGGFYIFHNVSGGVTPTALIRVDAEQFRYHVDHCHLSEPGSNKYTNGFTDGITTIPAGVWIKQPHFHNYSMGLRDGRNLWMSTTFPEGNLVAEVGSLAIVTHASAGPAAAAYIKDEGSGDTGWKAINGIANHTDATRPSCVAGLKGYMIFNTDDGAPNWCDGTNWVDATGTTT